MSEELSLSEALEVLHDAHTDRYLDTRTEGEWFIMEFESYGGAFQFLVDMNSGRAVLQDPETGEEMFST